MNDGNDKSTDQLNEEIDRLEHERAYIPVQADPPSVMWSDVSDAFTSTGDECFPFKTFDPFRFLGATFFPLPTFLSRWSAKRVSVGEHYASIVGDLDLSSNGLLRSSALAETISIRDALEKQLRRSAARLDELFDWIRRILKAWLFEVAISVASATSQDFLGNRFP